VAQRSMLGTPRRPPVGGYLHDKPPTATGAVPRRFEFPRRPALVVGNSAVGGRLVRVAGQASTAAVAEFDDHRGSLPSARTRWAPGH
jgi:hypothetical protein